MDEEQILKDKKRKKFKKLDIGDEYDDMDIDSVVDDDFEDVEDEIEYTFIPNIKDKQKKQCDILDDWV